MRDIERFFAALALPGALPVIRVPRRPRGTVPIIGFLMFALSAQDSHAFDVRRHVAMTGQLLGDFSFPFLASQMVQTGARMPDLAANSAGYCDGWHQSPCSAFPFVPCGFTSPDVEARSRQHFDNNYIWDFDGGITYVNTLLLNSRSALFTWDGNRSVANTLRAASSLYDLGRALHAVQDFYAHSNYVELQDEQWVTSDQVPLWNGDDYADRVRIDNNSGSVYLQGLQTGHFLLAPGSGSTTHTILNKDCPESDEGAEPWCLWFNCYTNYAIASGQFFSTGIDDYYGVGLGPRHTAKAIRAFLTGGAVFDNYPVTASEQAGGDIMSIVHELSADALFTKIATQAAAVLAMPDSNARTQIDEDTGLPKALLGVEHRTALTSLEISPPIATHEVEIRFGLAAASRVSIRLHDAMGRLVARRQQGLLGPGEHVVPWRLANSSGRGLTPGVYFVALEGDGVSRHARVIVLQ